MATETIYPLYVGPENERFLEKLSNEFGEHVAQAAQRYLDKKLQEPYAWVGTVVVDELIGYLRRWVRTTNVEMLDSMEKFILGYYGGSPDAEIRYW